MFNEMKERGHFDEFRRDNFILLLCQKVAQVPKIVIIYWFKQSFSRRITLGRLFSKKMFEGFIIRLHRPTVRMAEEA